MPALHELELTNNGQPLDSAPGSMGLLRDSTDATADRDELWRRWRNDGYLFLPGLLDREQVRGAREVMLARLAEVASFEFVNLGYHVTGNNPALERVLRQGPMVAFYELFLGGPVRCFDYTWFRHKKAQSAVSTQPHYDGVYMSRGTPHLFTSWTPFGDVPIEMGGLMLLESSHRNQELIAGYGQTDVDLYCETELAGRLLERARQEGRELTADENSQILWNSSGAYSKSAIRAQADLGGRWLTADYRMGDLVVFGMHLMHASHDNRTDEMRISTDTRYQLASDPVDERWIGDDPPNHTIRAKRGMIC